MRGNDKFKHYFCHILPAVFFAILFFCPIGQGSLNLTKSNVETELLWTFKLSFSELYKHSLIRYLFYSLYIIPCGIIFSVASLFTKKNFSKWLYIADYVCLSVYVFANLMTLVYTANSAQWFATLPVCVYVFMALAITAHISMTWYGLRVLKNDNPQYVEYKQLTEKSAKKEKKTFSIKTKLNITVISTMAVIVVTFTIIVLNRYHSLITESVSDIGRAKAEQTAAVYESADGKYAKIENFFETQSVSNGYADSPFERIDIIITDSTDFVYLEDVTEESNFPDFNILAYTTGKPSVIDVIEKSIPADNAKTYVKLFQTGAYRRSPVYDRVKKTCKYIYPVTFTHKNEKHRLIGFSIVTYRQEVLMESFFKTKVFVFTAALVFLYISIIISLLLSDLIVNPLLFLTANVRKASNSISGIISGSKKNTPESLHFDDTITTKDEVKDLSLEIDNLVSLIRGIIPYISFSTLKNAEKDTRRSSARELCFLFTDIRGFTTLCEGLPPKDVVAILNHYLDIETKIILDNGGDVDKFVGDEMMAFFAGPKKEYNACKAAMEIRAAMASEQQKARKEGDSFISIGIGINTGKVVFGPVGSSTRMDFTSIGDTVNLASRLEGANKAYGSKSIITEAVYAKLQDSFICRELDFITVKGKTEPVRIYEILQKTDSSTEKIYEIKNLFENGLALYREQKWVEAEKYFNQCAVKYRDYPSIIFMDRIRHFKRNPPPADWDGVFAMKVK